MDGVTFWCDWNKFSVNRYAKLDEANIKVAACYISCNPSWDEKSSTFWAISSHMRLLKNEIFRKISHKLATLHLSHDMVSASENSRSQAGSHLISHVSYHLLELFEINGQWEGGDEFLPFVLEYAPAVLYIVQCAARNWRVNELYAVVLLETANTGWSVTWVSIKHDSNATWSHRSSLYKTNEKVVYIVSIRGLSHWVDPVNLASCVVSSTSANYCARPASIRLKRNSYAAISESFGKFGLPDWDTAFILVVDESALPSSSVDFCNELSLLQLDFTCPQNFVDSNRTHCFEANVVPFVVFVQSTIAQMNSHSGYICHSLLQRHMALQLEGLSVHDPSLLNWTQFQSLSVSHPAINEAHISI